MNEASEEVANGGIRKSARISARIDPDEEEHHVDNALLSDDISEILKGVTLFEKGVEKDSSTLVAMTSHDVTMKHATRTNKLELSFISTLSSITNGEGVLKWAEQLKEVDNPNFIPSTSSSEKVPKLFLLLAGAKTRVKKQLCNAAIVDWQLDMKKEKVKEGDIPFKQPSTQNVEIRAFFAHMAKQYGWVWKDKDFKGFEGALNGVLTKLYKERQEEFVSKERNANDILK